MLMPSGDSPSSQEDDTKRKLNGQRNSTTAAVRVAV